MTGPRERIDVSRLLTIDVASELRKLTDAQLQGPWQLPAELVRRAIRGKARRVEVSLGRQLVSVRDDGEGLDENVLRQLGVLLDEGRDASARHGALIELERAGALALLALVGLEPARLRLVTSAATGARVLEYERGGGAPRLRDFAPPAPAGTVLELYGARLDRSRARSWLTSVCRFSPADIVLDGRPVPRGFSDAFSRVTLREPLAGALAIAREGDDARAWLLQDGVVSTHVTVTPAPCFEAAVEMGSMVAHDASAASLRDSIERQLDELIGQGIDHLIELGKRSQALAPTVRERVTQLLLQAARQRHRSAEIARLPLFRGFERDDSGAPQSAWFDLLSIRAAVEQDAGERTVTALFPEQDPIQYAVGSRTFVLDEAERSLLSELLGLRFRQPRRREGTLAWGRLTLAAARRLLQLGDSVMGALWRKSAVDEEELTPAEHRFLQILRSALGGQRTAGQPVREVCLCEGKGRARCTGQTLWLPRENADVRACVEAVAADPSWAYPALLSLLDGRALPSAHARFAWTQARARG